MADLIRDRYRLNIPSIDLLEELREGPLAFERLDPLVGCALRIAGDAGWVPVVVTNGPHEQQESRIRRTGLDRYIADWVISEQAGVSKPNPRIFALAAQRVRMRLGGAWVVGDSPEADIGGAAAMGLPSVWLHRGREWLDKRYAPTRVVGNVIQGLSADHGPPHGLNSVAPAPIAAPRNVRARVARYRGEKGVEPMAVVVLRRAQIPVPSFSEETLQCESTISPAPPPCAGAAAGSTTTNRVS
jgi:putative hydrolase of the HAD superfamily